MKTYVLRNDQLGTPVYLCGSCDLAIGSGIVFSPVVFNAEEFSTKGAAKEIAKQLPGVWTISEMSGLQVSENLMMAVRS